MNLHEIGKIKGNKRSSKRLGRGRGSGKGDHTVGKGQKGQKTRSKVSLGFEGGQTPLYKRLPQMGGFTNPNSREIQTISLSSLNVFEDGAEVTPVSLVEKRVLKNLTKDGTKILANGELTKKLILKGFLFSDSARKKVEKTKSEIVNA